MCTFRSGLTAYLVSPRQTDRHTTPEFKTRIKVNGLACSVLNGLFLKVFGHFLGKIQDQSPWTRISLL